MTLYVIESFERADSRPRVGAFTVEEAVVHEATWADRKRVDGWEPCGTCGGTGIENECRWANEDLGHDCDGCPCPDCAHGLVPPDWMTEAAARVICDDVRLCGIHTADARAALVAAARKER